MQTPLTPLEFARRARSLYGDREAVVDGDRRWTYREFLDRCDRWSSALQGLGVAPGANIGTDAAVFEPVHGSAPKYAGLDKANPTALLLSAVLMLEHLQLDAKAHAIMAALKSVLASGHVTPDLGGTATTTSFADAIARELSS